MINELCADSPAYIRMCLNDYLEYA